MQLHQITEQAGAHKRRKRVGRGESSGMGRTSGRGNKGMGARAGSGPHPLHEGGAMPFFRRIPKRGFSNFHFRDEYDIVNLAALEKHFSAGAVVDRASLLEKHLIRGRHPLLKVLGNGELTKKLSVTAHAASASARAAIEKAGGSLKLIERPDSAALAKAKRNTAKTAAKGAAKKS